jgi:hypothetical protein
MTDDTPARLDPGKGHDGDLTNRFTYHPPEPEQPEVYQAVRDAGHLLALLIDAATYPSREQSLAITKVEEAVMWANAAVARRGLTDLGMDGAAGLIDQALTDLTAAKPHSLLGAPSNG